MKIIPVIHHINEATTLEQAELIAQTSCYGLFLISMTADNEHLPMLGKVIKARHPNLKVGLNLLGQSAIKSLDYSLDFNLDMTWSDNQVLNSKYVSEEAVQISKLIKKNSHQFFNSVAFKYQEEDLNPGQAALFSESQGFIPTTSGVATGKAADLDKIKIMSDALLTKSLAIASGLTPDNIQEYLPFVEYGLVSTGISKNFHEIEPEKLNQLLKNAQL